MMEKIAKELLTCVELDDHQRHPSRTSLRATEGIGRLFVVQSVAHSIRMEQSFRLSIANGLGSGWMAGTQGDQKWPGHETVLFPVDIAAIYERGNGKVSCLLSLGTT